MGLPYIDPPGTTPTDRQIYGSPMERLGVVRAGGVHLVLVRASRGGRVRREAETPVGRGASEWEKVAVSRWEWWEIFGTPYSDSPGASWCLEIASLKFRDVLNAPSTCSCVGGSSQYLLRRS